MGKGLSKEQLKKFKKRLRQEKQKIEREIEELKSQDPFSDPDRLVENQEDEDAREEIGHETIVAQIASLEKTLEEVEHALKKIEKGNYGKCELCGKMIVISRLEVLPYARFCIKCQKKME